MRLSELSRRSGVATATVKFYLREGLLPPGRRITATQAEYDERHLRRLRLVRALIQVGGVSVASAREVLAALDDDSLDQNERLGTAVCALPHGKPADADDPAMETARRRAEQLLELLDWGYDPATGATIPAYGMLVTAIAALERLGYPCTVADLEPYARTLGRLAVNDLDLVERYGGTADEQVEAAVALTVLYEPVLLALRRLAEAEESRRRFGRK
ncbi:MerR family transcriptional regulator [Streptomyces chromofuscus]|uniref:MerR family transcriptional regulator n=1 Tax=Streptomyces chromofuscus TaxID=42881 RepID=A0A7M2T3P3_STRCW|nr:MerR family transcriptional regulator [Streptomyces chromofuscus]QOV43256.1 MerR family transcriptional regulator [Streptomyces chromofuscus]GGT30035.1 transcriptional regulator [Streptomyces chromofuscus]